MSRSKSLIGADPASIKILEAAMHSSAGIQLIFPTRGAAEARRFSLYHARKCDRKQHPPNYISKYDQLSISLQSTGDHWLLSISRGWMDPSVQIIDRATGQPVDLNQYDGNLVPGAMLQPPGMDQMPKPQGKPHYVTREEMERQQLELDANLTDNEIEMLVAGDLGPTSDEDKRKALQQRRSEAKAALGIPQ